MKQNYSGLIEDKELDDYLKTSLLKKGSKANLEVIAQAIESSDSFVPEECMDLSKEQAVINKLREKTGMTGIGLAGTSFLGLLLFGVNLM